MIALWIFSGIKLFCFKELSDAPQAEEYSQQPLISLSVKKCIPKMCVLEFLRYLDCVPCVLLGKKSLLSPQLLSSYIDFLHCCKKGTDYRASSLHKKGKVIWSACNPVHAFQAAILSILFGYVKNVEYQQWVSVPYCWVLYELILLQSQKKKRKERKTYGLDKNVYSPVHSQLPVHSVTDRQSEETLVLVLRLSSDSPLAFCFDPWRCVCLHVYG